MTSLYRENCMSDAYHEIECEREETNVGDVLALLVLSYPRTKIKIISFSTDIRRQALEVKRHSIVRSRLFRAEIIFAECLTVLSVELFVGVLHIFFRFHLFLLSE